MKREKEIVKTSIYGILVNLALVAFKATVGLITNSISIVLDAVNNFTDALSSIVTILGVKLASKRPNKKHPFGYGRVEYFSAVVVAIIILAAGIAALKESIEKIITPVEADYSVVSLIIVAVAVLVKFFFGQYVKKKGHSLNSKSLIASGIDAISDSALSLSVLIGALISFFFHVSLEGYIGIIISIVIIKTAIEILRDAVDDIIGTKADDSLLRKLKKTINSHDEVRGVYDVTMHNYGPNKIIASAHIELDDNMKTREIHRLSRQIEVEVFQKYGIVLTIGIYASNDSPKYKAIKESVQEIVKRYKSIKQMHGFYVDDEKNVVSFDVVYDFNEHDALAKNKEICAELKNLYPKYDFYIVIDTDTL